MHPYLLVPGVAVDDLLLQVPARNRLLVDGRLLPIGAARVAGSEFDFTEPAPDRADRAGHRVRRRDAGRRRRLSAVTLSTWMAAAVEVWADAAFGWWQVFTGDTLAGRPATGGRSRSSR